MTKPVLYLTICAAGLAGLTLFRIDTRPSTSRHDISFERDVLPVLVAGGCARCHGGDGGLDLTSVRRIRAGGDSGPAVVPGSADSSLLIQRVVSDPPFPPSMPPVGRPLTASSVDIIRAWIDQGARDN